MPTLKTSFIIALCALATSVASTNCSSCKCTPHDACWPSEEDFSRLNSSISGRLIRTVPPASVCYPDQPNHDPAACKVVLSSWYDAGFHSRDPTSIGAPIWAGNPCPPIYPNGTSVNGDPKAGAKGCTIGGYPAFAVNATHPSHVQKAVKFARAHNLRLNVKSTGHSFQGRSTAFGSLSIYTNNYRRIKFHETFQPQDCPRVDAHMAATLGAGESMRAVYSGLAKHNAIVVGGSAQTVGVVGWFTGGGHGPLSSEYGMGADNLLQVTLVTPQGDLVTANACHHSDLFWALRGGGGGTFGVVLEVVMKAFPSPKTTYMQFGAQFFSPNDADNWRMLAYLHSEMPRLKEGGLQGYYTVVPASMAGALTVGWGFLAYDKPNGTVEALFEPIKRKLEEDPTKAGYINTISHYPSFYDAWNSYIGFEAVAEGGAGFGSRLLPASALENVDRLAQALYNVTIPRDDGTPVVLIGHMIANSKNAGLDISMTPAWRKAVTHLVVIDPFVDYTDKETQERIFHHMTHERIPILKSLAPDSGAYLNEADPFDPDFQHTFWADNYQRLQSIKKKYDPSALLWCLSCVGSEEWSVKEDGRLCRA
ncbi:FAD-linked oxidoreductase ZEB1 [Paramyrothecium foliicola]|nr:FAD-linked oxidoreductase ZEB1 [Paramyrothecium foliicola]